MTKSLETPDTRIELPSFALSATPLAHLTDYALSWGQNLWQQAQSWTHAATSYLNPEEIPLFIKAEADPDYQNHLAWKRALKVELKQLIKALKGYARQGQKVSLEALGAQLIAQHKMFEPETASSLYYTQQLQKLAQRLPPYAAVIETIIEHWQRQLASKPELAKQYFYQDSVRLLIQRSADRYSHTTAKNQLARQQSLLDHYQSLIPKHLHASVQSSLQYALSSNRQTLQQLSQCFAESLAPEWPAEESQRQAEGSLPTSEQASTSSQAKAFMTLPSLKQTIWAAGALVGIGTYLAESYESPFAGLTSLANNLVPVVTFSTVWHCLKQPGTQHPFSYSSQLAQALPIVVSGLSQLCYANAQSVAPSYGIKILGSSRFDNGRAVSVTSEGEVVVAGYTYGVDNYDLLLSRWSANGTLLWARTLGGSGDDYGNGVSVTPDGEAIVTGETNSFGAGSVDLWLSRWSADGTLLWRRTLGGSGGDKGNAVSVTPEGEAIVAGTTNSFGAGSNDLWLSRWSANGTLLWVRTLGGSDSDYGFGLSVTPEGEAIVTGITTNFDARGVDLWLSRWSASGSLIWVRTLGGSGTDYGNAVSVTSDGEAIVAGSTESFGVGGRDLLLSRWSANGTLLWARTLGGSDADQGSAVSVTPEGEAYVAGFTNSFISNAVGNSNLWLSRWSANGTLLWVKTLGDSSGFGQGNAVSVTPENEAIVVSYTTSFGAVNADILLSRWGAQGQIDGSRQCVKTLDIQPTDITGNVTLSIPPAVANTTIVFAQTFNITPQIFALNVSTICNFSPSLNSVGGSFYYRENDPATIIDASLTLSLRADYNIISSAKVVVSTGFTMGQDVLGFYNQQGIAGSYNGTSGELVMIGDAEVPAYQAALRNVTYINLSQNPSTGLRTFTFTANDGFLVSNPVARNATIIAINDPPVLENHVLTVGQGEAITLTSANLSAYDIDSNNQTLTFKVGNITRGGFTRVDEAVLQFVQGDIGAGYIKFNHDGSVYPPSFTVQVSDGALESAPVSAQITFNLMPTASSQSASLTGSITSSAPITNTGSSASNSANTPTSSSDSANTTSSSQTSSLPIIAGAVGATLAIALGGAIVGAVCYKKRRAKHLEEFPLENIQGETKPATVPIVIEADDIPTAVNSSAESTTSSVKPSPAMPAAPSKPLPTPRPASEINVSLAIPYGQLSFGKKLGEGQFGIVYQGTYHHDDVAIKQLKNTHLSPAAIREFSEEMAVMASLRNPNIVQLYGVCVEQMPYCLVMEYLPKGSLYGILHSQAPMSWPEREVIATDIAKGLVYLHSKDIYHCDLKSLNVLLDNQGHAKLSDFGLAKVKNETKSSNTKSEQVGTIAWMAPELFERHARYTEKSDIYSYGITLWEVASRQIPFSDAHDKTIIVDWVRKGEREKIPEETPPKLAKLIKWCWSAKQNERPTANQIIEVLKAEDKSAEIPSPDNIASYLDNFSQGKGELSLDENSGPDYRSNFSGPQSTLKF